jgi:SpoVK/Ycf46/Vps4 family AAA+-type ATPase
MSAEKIRIPARPGQLGVLQPRLSYVVTLLGTVSNPLAFPIEHLATGIDWDDLVLHPDTLRQVQAMARQLAPGPAASNLGAPTPGYRALFHGPAGTGKTLTAAVLSKYLSKKVVHIDAAQVVAKYSGETEKNLTRLFEQAEANGWVLFFDEADALFGKRTGIRNAHDKYANQEASYLLQRLEAYKGVAILAAEHRTNIDEAFLRRLRTSIQFPALGVEERAAIWQKMVPQQLSLAPDISWPQVAARHGLTGTAILQVIHCCTTALAAAGSQQLTLKQLEDCIRQETSKAEQTVRGIGR